MGTGGAVTRARLVIAEDHPDTQEALRQRLADDYEIVALVGDGQAALAAAAALHPDLVLLDISMPVLGGMPTARRMSRRMPEIKLIFVTAHADPLYLAEAFRSGARGYVVKQALDSELIPAVTTVLAGGTYRSPTIEP